MYNGAEGFTVKVGSKTIAEFGKDSVHIPAAGISKLLGADGKTIRYGDIVRFSLMQNSSVLSFYVAAEDANGKVKGTNITHSLDKKAAVVDFEKAASLVRAANPQVKIYFPDSVVKP